MTNKEQIEEMNTIMQEAHNNYCEHNSCVNCPYRIRIKERLWIKYFI